MVVPCTPARASAVRALLARAAIPAALLPLAAGVALAPSAASAATACANLAVTVSSNVVISLAQENPAAPGVPAHCEVIGAINPRTGVDGQPYAIGFHLRMPDAWNARFFFQGGGGTDGNLGTAINPQLALGYAVVSTDAGHDNTINNDPLAGGTAAFGLDPQARIDWGYNALDQVTTVAKGLLESYFGRSASYSYFDGCSDGGRQAMMMAERFPTYFDGIVAGSPGFDLPRAAVAEAWNEQALAPLATRLDVNNTPFLPDTFSPGDLNLVSGAIAGACDALDGLVDGIVDNSPACTTKLVMQQLTQIQCVAAKTDQCLTAGQIAALKKIHHGPKNALGEQLYADLPWDPGINGPSSFGRWSVGSQPLPGQPLVNNALNLTLGGGSLPLVFVTPPVAVPVTQLAAYVFSFDFNNDAPRIYQTSGIYKPSSMRFAASNSPDLAKFNKVGGKIVLYHGNADGVFSDHDTIAWLKATDAVTGGASDFARLFLVPGMSHCSGGPATYSFDPLAALVDWVEHGVAPSRIVATAPAGTPWPGRTRPLCPYPKQAHYKGAGSIEDAASFTCANP